MPYINKELRPRFDNIIDIIKGDDYGVALVMLLKEVKNLRPTQVGGCLNYTFTMLLKNEKWHNPYLDNFIYTALKRIFCTPPKYYKLEAAIGLLGCMTMEFGRRQWSIVSLRALYDIKNKFYNEIIRPYEDKKIEKNGDLND